ncbi:MAG: TM0996/MTH895 family glutaredoxin-like protein [Armatimonadetes bacterium]|nr:TM0996/MTH895 family glutaredoxin-like protein [Armatimonadota bacterium]
MRIEILGMGCPKCKKLVQAAEEAVKATGAEAEVVKVEDMDQILKYKVMMTPALVIDGEVKSTGKVLSAQQIAEMIKEALR